MGQDRDRTTGAQPVDIYGPEGLRMWLRVAIRYSVSRIVPPYRVHEIKDIPMAPEWDFSRRSNRFYYNVKNSNGQWGTQGLPGEDPQSWISRANFMNLEPNYQYGEIDGGRYVGMSITSSYAYFLRDGMMLKPKSLSYDGELSSI